MTDEIVTLSSGVRAVIKPVPTYLVDQMQAAIKEPVVPTQYIEKLDRHEENPWDADYQREVAEANAARGRMAMEAMIMFGFELVDELPDPDTWLPKLKWLEKRTTLDLSQWDLDDPIDLEFVFKALIAVSGVDLMKVTIKSGMRNEEIDLAMRSFRGLQGEDADQTGEHQVQGSA
jgi:hypothetical protein